MRYRYNTMFTLEFPRPTYQQAGQIESAEQATQHDTQHDTHHNTHHVTQHDTELLSLIHGEMTREVHS